MSWLLARADIFLAFTGVLRSPMLVVSLFLLVHREAIRNVRLIREAFVPLVSVPRTRISHCVQFGKRLKLAYPGGNEDKRALVEALQKSF